MIKRHPDGHGARRGNLGAHLDKREHTGSRTGILNGIYIYLGGSSASASARIAAVYIYNDIFVDIASRLQARVFIVHVSTSTDKYVALYCARVFSAANMYTYCTQSVWQILSYPYPSSLRSW